MSISNFSLRPTRDDEKHLPAYDNTKLTAYNTCPTYATIRYTLHRVMPGAGRALPLEAGEAMHQCFAAIRLWQLKNVQGHAELSDNRFAVLFPDAERRATMNERQSQANLTDAQKLRHFAVQCLLTSGYYDDPADAKRTLANMEQALLYYIDRWSLERYPVYVSGSFVGIELAFDLVLEYDEVPANSTQPERKKLRFIGRTDGLHTDGPNGEPILQENKTAWRLDDAWRNSFDLSHQITGYMNAATVLGGVRTTRAVVIGLTLPLPRDITKGCDHIYVTRSEALFERWAKWFVYTHKMRQATFDNPILAAKFTHSCNRFFRTCEFLPFCVSDDEEQKQMLEELETKEWSPLNTNES